MKAKNYVVTAMGFVKDRKFNKETREPVIEYTHKVREAQTFSTKAGLDFLERHGIDGWIWTPYAQEPVRDMYTVKQNKPYGFENDEELIHIWQPVRLRMVHDSDVSFLTSHKIQADNAMTFEEAKAVAIQRNADMLEELMKKNERLKNTSENVKG